MTPSKFDRTVIVQILSEASRKPAAMASDPNQDLFEVGALDSFTMVQLVSLLEKRLGIVFDYSDFKAQHFVSVDALMKLLDTKYADQVK